MPKVRTRSSAKKRFNKVAHGLIKHARAFKRHLLTKKSRKTKRHLRKAGYYATGVQKKTITTLMPY